MYRSSQSFSWAILDAYKFQPTHSTIEDVYTAVIETDRGVKEKVRIFDIGTAAQVRLAKKNII